MKAKVLSCIVVFFLSTAPYLSILDGGFVYDDSSMVLENKNVIGKTTLFQVFFDKQVMVFSGEIYRPLRDLSYRFDWLIGGTEPTVYHATNIILHAITSLTVFWFLFVWSENITFSFISAALFGVHPVHTESVAWIKGRDDLLFTLFYILSFGTYISYEQSNNRRRLLYYISSLSLFILALFSKEMAITLPVSIALYQAIFKRFKASVLVPFVIVAAFYLGLRTYVLSQVAQSEYWGGGIIPTMLTMIKGIVQYVRLSILSINQSADYFSFPVSNGPDLSVIWALSLLISVFIYLLKTKDKFVQWGGLFFFVSLLPVSNIIPIKILIAERFLYLPLLGLCILMASSLSRVLTDRRHLYIASGVILVLFFTLTAKRAVVWMDEYSLWSDTLRKAPDNARAHYGMGTSYASKGMMDEAIKEFKESIRLAPFYPEPFNGLGLAYYKKGMVDEAMDSYADYRKTQGLISYYKKGQVEDAIIQYEKALKLDPSHRDARYNLALLYHEQGQVDDAIREYNELLRFKPDDLEALNSLGLAYFQKGLFDEAILHYKRAIAVDAGSVAPYNNIGMAYAVRGQTGEAEQWFKKALVIDPESAETYYNIGLMYQKSEELNKAAEAYKKALAINPDYKEAINRLAELKE